MTERYILVQWPESQLLMDHPRFGECILGMDIDGHVEVGSSAYLVPESLFNELFNVSGKKRVGLFMGSFDPPHKGHLGVARKAITDGLVDEVLIIPTPGNPWKGSPGISFSKKLSYCIGTFGKEFRVVSGLSDEEVISENIKGLQDSDGKYYSYRQILRVILSDESYNPLGSAEYRILCGTDVYNEIKNWKYGAWILENFPPILIDRPGYSEESDPSLLKISSTEIRDRIKEGDWKGVEPFLDPTVLEWIRKDNVYG